MSRRHRLRSCSGSETAEIGPTLWIVFMVLFFPMVSLATVGIRYMFMLNATRMAAIAAAESYTFQTNLSGTQLSAVNTARTQAQTAVSAFHGISLVGGPTATAANVPVSIVISSLSSNTVTRQTTPLSAPANVSNNLYSIEVQLIGQIQPLAPSKYLAGMPNIPLLNAPVPVVTRYDVVAENPQGLNQ